MSTLLSLTKAVDEAKKAMLAAKSEKEREKLLATYTAAVQAASTYEKTTVKEKETEGETEGDDEEGSESDDDEEEESTEGGSSSSAAAEDDKAAKALLGAKSGLYTHDRLFRVCKQTAQKITGKTKLSVQEIFGAIDGAGASAKANVEITERLAKLEGANRTGKVKALLATAMRDGKVTPAEAKQLEAQDPKWLKGYLASKPKTRAVRTLEDGDSAPVTLDGGSPLAGRSEGQRDIITRSAARLGKTPEEVAKDLDAAMAKQTNGVSARY